MRWPDRTAAYLLLALAAALTGCASNEALKDARLADVANAVDVLDVKTLRLTSQVSGWTEEAGSYAAFDASNLFNLINGGAQPHVDRGLVVGIYQILASGAGRRVEIMAEDFGSAGNAQTMYAFAKGMVADALSLPNYPTAAAGDVVLGGAVFHVVLSRYYFKLTFTGYTTAERQTLLTDAESFVAVYEQLTTQ